jgi:hypothetical protein
LEDLILELVRDQRGLKETDLWVLLMAGMNRRPSGRRECIAPALIVRAIHRMIHHGDLVGIDYTISGEENTFVLPGVLPGDVVPTIRQEGAAPQGR